MIEAIIKWEMEPNITNHILQELESSDKNINLQYAIYYLTLNTNYRNIRYLNMNYKPFVQDNYI